VQLLERAIVKQKAVAAVPAQPILRRAWAALVAWVVPAQATLRWLRMTLVAGVVVVGLAVIVFLRREVPSFSVSATQDWNSTGMTVDSGKTVRIQYISGTWSDSSQIAPFDANGEPNINVCGVYYPTTRCVEPMANRPKGALIARIGHSEPIYIGNQATFQARTSGILELGMNDSTLAADLLDNTGSVLVSITVTG